MFNPTNLPVPTSVATHDGIFHADDVFAIALLKILYPGIEVIRTRDPDILAKVNLRVDVGNKHDPYTGDFDHHQNDATRYPDITKKTEYVREPMVVTADEFEAICNDNKLDWQVTDVSRSPSGKYHFTKVTKRQVTIPGPKMAGVGLVWDAYGKSVIKSHIAEVYNVNLDQAQVDEIHTTVRDKFIIPIEIDDNGEGKTYFNNNYALFKSTSMSDVIKAFIPTMEFMSQSPQSSNVILNGAFDDAVQVAMRFIKGNIESAYSSIKNREYVFRIVKEQLQSPGIEYVVFDNSGSWMRNLNDIRRNHPEYSNAIEDLRLGVYPIDQEKKNWRIQSIKSWDKKQRRAIDKCLMPERLRGKTTAELRQMTDIPSITFVHASGFIGGAGNKDDAVALAKLALKELNRES